MLRIEVEEETDGRFIAEVPGSEPRSQFAFSATVARR
jgi:hypothetical protein